MGAFRSLQITRNLMLILDEFKGQIFSKGLFGVLEFSQKTNSRIRRSSKNEFVCLLFGRIRGYQKFFQNFFYLQELLDNLRKVSSFLAQTTLVQLSLNYYYFIQNLCFDDKMKIFKFSASKLQELNTLSKSQLSLQQLAQV